MLAMALMGFNNRPPTDFSKFTSDLDKKDIDARLATGNPLPKEEKPIEKQEKLYD
jgi:hypothetical protein